MTTESEFTFVAEKDLDSRRRLSLSKIGKPEHTRYRATVLHDHSILLEPMVSVLVTDLPDHE